MLHAAVANFEPRVLVSATATGASKACKDIASQVLLSNTLPTTNQRVTFASGQVNCHMLVDSEVRYLVLAAPDFPTRQAVAALEDMRDQFSAQFGTVGIQATDEDAARMSRTFHSVLAATLEASSSAATTSRMAAVRAGVDKVKSQAMRGIETAMANTERLQTLESKSEELSLRATQFNRASSRVSRHMWWASKKMQIVAAIVVVFVLFILMVWYATSN